MKRTLLVPALVAIVLAACSPFARPELSRARERWQAAHVNHYRYKLNVGCFCGFTEKMPLTIEVKEGQLVARIDPESFELKVRQAEAAYRVAEATIRQREADRKLAEVNLERNRSLLEVQRELNRIALTKALAPMTGLVSIRQNRSFADIAAPHLGQNTVADGAEAIAVAVSI